MPQSRKQLDAEDADRIKMRADARRRGQIQDMADIYRIPFYLRDDGSIHQHPPGQRFLPVEREPSFDHFAGIPPEKPAE